MSLEQPDYYCWSDRQLYEELTDRACKGYKLTEKENSFCSWIYHQEEYACGLDGDR